MLCQHVHTSSSAETSCPGIWRSDFRHYCRSQQAALRRIHTDLPSRPALINSKLPGLPYSIVLKTTTKSNIMSRIRMPLQRISIWLPIYYTLAYYQLRKEHPVLITMA